MPSNQVIPSAGRPLSPGAVALMLMLCLSWGFNQIAVKLALPDVPPMLQAMIRSARRVAGVAPDRAGCAASNCSSATARLAPGCLRACCSVSNSC